MNSYISDYYDNNSVTNTNESTNTNKNENEILKNDKKKEPNLKLRYKN